MSVEALMSVAAVSSRTLSGALALLLAAAGSGCLGVAHPAALYGNGDHLASDQVATLYGPIASVDGKDVSGKGRTFELLPGCHLVQLLRQVGDSSNTGSWSAHLPPYLFAIWMRPGRAYVISYQVQSNGGPTGTIYFDAEERDRSGTVRRFGPARGQEDVERCKDGPDARESA
jgi:hypothetical protein